MHKIIGKLEKLTQAKDNFNGTTLLSSKKREQEKDKRKGW